MPLDGDCLIHLQGGSGDGANPYYGEVAFDQAGNIYGTTRLGGQNGQGTVYELTRSGNTWTNTVLHSFGGTGDGKFPMHNVIFDRAGNLTEPLMGMAVTTTVPFFNWYPQAPAGPKIFFIVFRRAEVRGYFPRPGSLWTSQAISTALPLASGRTVPVPCLS